MILIEIYFIFTLVNFVLSILFNYLQSRQRQKDVIAEVKKYNAGKYVIVCLTIACFVLFCLNFNNFIKEPSNYVDLILINISQIAFIFSICIFLNSLTIESKYLIRLNYPSRSKSRKGEIKLGKILHKNKKKYDFYLSMGDLEGHMFVTGTTGSGKSTLLQYFLLNFTKNYDIPFLLAEFKGEYHFLQEKIKDMLIIKAGENFSINIFDPEGGDPEIHAERVYEIFESGGLLEGVEYSPQMERVFVDILNKICPKPEYRNWESFKVLSSQYLTENRQIKFVEQSVVAIQNRIRRYSLGTLKDIFVKKAGFDVKELFDYNVILDLSSIIRLGGEKEDALFFLNMILKYLWDRNIAAGSKDYKGIRHITIIEDAQYFAPEELSQRTKLTSYIEDITLLLRGTGECLITVATRPKISKEILANCGVFVSFQNHMQKDLMQELLNLRENQKEYLSMLQRGQCIVRVNSIEKPFVLQSSYVERSWLTDEEIARNNQKVLERKLEMLESKLDEAEEKVTETIEAEEKVTETIEAEEKVTETIEAEEKVTETIETKSFCKFCGEEITPESEYCEACSAKQEEKRRDFEELKAYIKNLDE